jgi:hypothetical protein
MNNGPNLRKPPPGTASTQRQAVHGAPSVQNPEISAENALTGRRVFSSPDFSHGLLGFCTELLDRKSSTGAGQ